MLYNGTADTDLIIYWTEEFLLPSLQPNSVLIWDNAGIHKSQRMKDLIEKAGHTILFLSPYSPDLNPIEHKWAEIKHNLSKFYDDSIDFIANLSREVNRLSKCGEC